MADSAAPNDSKELLSLCRAGRLYDVEKWIAAGKSQEIETPRNRRKKTLLQIAVETGFHSLVELIAKHGPDQCAKNAALADAVQVRRLDLVELLVSAGAEIAFVPFADVLFTWDPKLIQFFLDHGADVITDCPFAAAFGERVRTALRAFLDCRQKHPELAKQLQEQLDCALRHFCYEGDLKWVSLLTWAGADPRSWGPALEKDYTEDPECYTTGLREACSAGRADIVKKFKPTKDKDNLSDLLNWAAFSVDKETIRYLLDQGADPNEKRDSESSGLDSALARLNTFDIHRTGGLRSKYSVYKEMDCIGELLSRGARWNPDRDHMNWLRKTLIESEPELTIALLELFRKHNACSADQVHRLIDTPRMQEHLASQSLQLLRLGITPGLRKAALSETKSRMK
jgi:ankyrin repeat protein